MRRQCTRKLACARKAGYPGRLALPQFLEAVLERKVLTGVSGCVSLILMKREEILKSRQQLARALADPTEIVRGSLLDRKIFHRRGCRKCARGEGHRVWILTVGYPGGRTKQFTISREQKSEVERWLRNYRKLRAQLETICELNHQLLKAEP